MAVCESEPQYLGIGGSTAGSNQYVVAPGEAPVGNVCQYLDNVRHSRGALIASLSREAKKGKRTTRLQAVADRLVELALEGDYYAVREIFDRIDGSPAH